MHLYIMQMLAQIADDIDEKTGEQYAKKLEDAFRSFQAKGGNLGYE